MGAADTAAPGSVDVGLTATHLARPVVLDVPSADPAGADFEAVGSLWDVTLLGAVGVASGLEVDVAVPFTLHRSGVGVSPLADQRTEQLSGAALGDLRLGAALRLLQSDDTDAAFRVAARLDLALPTGDEGAFSGERSVVAVPAVSGELRSGPWIAGAELGARLRAASDVAGSRVGSQLVVGVGLGAALLTDDALSIALEAVALPTFASQEQLAYIAASGQREVVGHGPALVPTEWMASFRALFTPNFTARVGAGGGLALFGASDVTAPSFRLVLSTTYAFGGDGAKAR
jgi:hypothetical protein